MNNMNDNYEQENPGDLLRTEEKIFNLKTFPILSDDYGQYTEEPILLGIANHLHMCSFGGGGSLYGSSGSISLDEMKNVDWAAFEKYGAGNYKNFKNAVMNRTIKNVPTAFLNTVKKVSEKTGCPTSLFVVVGQSESNFRDARPNSYGYGGYFGQKSPGPYGYGNSLEQQCMGVVQSYNATKRSSQGASPLDLTMLTYVYHHLPAVGSKYWNKTNGKIWSTDPDYIMSNIKACYAGGSAVRYAEALLINMAAQYMALQVKNMNL